MMTRDEFEKLAREMMEAEHLRRVAIVSGFDTVEFFSGEVAAKQAALLAAYDAMAARIAELEAERDAARAEAQARLESCNAEADEFNAGFDAYRAGLSPDDEPEVAHDVWRVGYAWAAYDTHIARIAELEAQESWRLKLDRDFVDGFKAHRKGTPYEAFPAAECDGDWQVGWAWAAFESMRARIRDLEEQIAEHAVYSHEVATLNEARERIAELEAMLELRGER